MHDAMESLIKTATRGTVRIGAVVLFVCLTLASTVPTPGSNHSTVILPSAHDLAQTHKPSTQSTEIAEKEIAWGIKTAANNASEMVPDMENSNSGTVVSTIQTVEDNSISTRMRRMSSGRAKEAGVNSDIIKQLYCRNGYRLAIYDNETINGTMDKFNPYTQLRVTTAGVSRVRIKGVLSGMYVCMNRRGRLYPSPHPRAECIFQETFFKRTFYVVFSTDVHSRRKWYIGLNTNGQPRPGNKTKRKNIMAHFLLEKVDWNEPR